MATRHFCDFCALEGPYGNDGIQGYVLLCVGPGEQTDYTKGTTVDVCRKCVETLHITVEAQNDY